MLILRTRGGRYALPAAPAILAATVLMSVLAAAHAETTYKDNWYLEAIRTPTVAAANSRSDPVIIAVVDDGVRITHQDLAGFVWRNSQEIPNNRIDDDGNGFIDDIHGWDISDEDNDVVPGDRPDFYHGTHIAGIITEVAKAAYGESASDHIRILPVKSISDFEPTTYVKDGYRGIRYAIEAGADIIICAWGVGHITPEEERILREAADRGILIVSSSGNLPQELEQYPAAYESVLAVGSVERDGAKTTKSNYGQFVDMSAPGTGIRGASVLADDEYEVRDGTSFAAAMVATAAALVELNNPHLTRTDIKACLLSTSRPIDIKAREYSAKLGAGSLDIQAAVDCDLFNNPVDEETRLVHTKGFLRATARRKSSFNWTIAPQGEFSGIRFKPVFGRDQVVKGRIEVRSTEHADADVIANYSLDALPETIYVPGTTAYVTVHMKKDRKRRDWLLEYEAEPINFSRLYCHGTEQLRKEGTLSDGSGADRYSARSDCKWLITAPEDKVVQFRFDSLDTEARTDLIYFFDGARTNDQIMAIFSGDELPPEFTSWRNQVLVWFVSDDENHGQGWQANYSFEDPQAR